MQSISKVIHLPKIQLSFLLFLIAVTTFFRNPSTQILFAFVMSLGFTLLAELILLKVRGIKLFFPEAVVVTALIIFLLESPTAPWYEFLTIAFLAVASKQFLRVKKRHIFNPAALGLFFGNLFFGKTVAWWGVSWQQFSIFNFQSSIPVLILFLSFIISGIKLKRYLNIFTFLILYMILNHRFVFDSTVIFFGLVMLPEPMTTPNIPKQQIVFGLFIAFVSMIAGLKIFSFLPDLLIFSLLLANGVFFIYNNCYKGYKRKPAFARLRREKGGESNMKGNTLLWVVLVVVVVGGGYILLKGKNAGKMTQEKQVMPTIAVGQVSPMVKEEDKMTNKDVVNVTSAGFETKTVNAKVGTKVTWMNKSGAMSNVSSAKHPTHLVYPPLNLGNFADGASVSLVFKDKGTFKYHNHLDASQFGSVVVE